MARQSQIIFHAILFIIVYLDLICLLFVFYIRIFRPLFYFIQDNIFCYRRQVPTEHLQKIIIAMKAYVASRAHVVTSTKFWTLFWEPTVNKGVVSKYTWDYSLLYSRLVIRFLTYMSNTCGFSPLVLSRILPVVFSPDSTFQTVYRILPTLHL